jgi:mannose-6-phosphate isomerase-like protein (cupin superfamily)
VLEEMITTAEYSGAISATFVSLSGKHQPLITHSKLRVYLVVAGALAFLLNSTEKVTLFKGDVLTIEAGTLYEIEGVGEYYVLNVPGFRQDDDHYV